MMRKEMHSKNIYTRNCSIYCNSWEKTCCHLVNAIEKHAANVPVDRVV